MNLSLLSIVLVVCAVGPHWPAFLGSKSGPRQSSELPLRWMPDSGLDWMVEIEGHGQSSPVIWADKIFVTSVTGLEKDTFHITCFDRNSAAQEWSYELENSVPVTNSYYVSRAAPTPVVDADRIVALFESGDCIALTHQGELLWQRNLSADEGPLVAEFGLGASPCQTIDRVFILLEHDGPGCLLALDKQSGETLWKVPRSPGRSWSSPSVVEVAGHQHVVVSSNGSVAGFSPERGTKLWELEGIGGNTGCTPIDCGDGQFLIGASPGRNGENAGSAAQSNCLVRVTEIGGKFQAEKRWVAERAIPSWASPILHKGLAYWINRAGVVFCFDADTGANVFTERLNQSCWATPFAVEDRIYLFGKDGLTTVIEAGREFKVLAENLAWRAEDLPQESPLSEETSEERRQASAMFSKPTLYGYAVSNDAFYLRVGNALLSFSSNAKAAQPDDRRSGF